MERAVNLEEIARVSRAISEGFQPEKIILFGSWAWGNPTPDSDVDLLVVKETEDTRALARKIDGSIFPRPFPMDLIVCRPKNIEERRKNGDLFIREVLLKGKVLYDRSRDKTSS